MNPDIVQDIVMKVVAALGGQSADTGDSGLAALSMDNSIMPWSQRMVPAGQGKGPGSVVDKAWAVRQADKDAGAPLPGMSGAGQDGMNPYLNPGT